MHLELRHLRTIRAIHDQGGLARAAEVLNITQSALSHQVRALEDQAGTALFLRQTKPMRLSPAGLRLLALARQVLGWALPTVLDADTLQPELAGAGHDACIWTPHPGEAARLLDTSTPDVTRDPIAAARALQERFGGVVVLKGGPSTIAHAGGVWVSRGGHPGMASAGMGDDGWAKRQG